MKILAGLFICLTTIVSTSLTPALAITVGYYHLPSEPQKPNYSVSQNEFREHYLRSIDITGPNLGIILKGEWTDEQVKRIGALLEKLKSTRMQREATIYEGTVMRVMVLSVGDTFEFNQSTQHFINPAVAFGRGISEDIRFSYQIPMHASDEVILEMLKPVLPEILIRNEKKIEKYGKETADMMKGYPSFCSKILGLFR